MCGEKISLLYALADKEGSPPHVRGKGIFHIITTIYCRITPACAGKSCNAALVAGVTQDHPRMCGEKHTWLAYLRCVLGSPPHVRGKD